MYLNLRKSKLRVQSPIFGYKKARASHCATTDASAYVSTAQQLARYRANEQSSLQLSTEVSSPEHV